MKQPIAQEIVNEQGIVTQIARSEPARLGDHSIQPGQPESLHPTWGERSSPAEQRERVAHRQENSTIVTRLIVDDPSFHPPAVQRHPDKIRIRAVDRFRKLRFVRFSPAAKRWTDRADNLDVGLQLNGRAFETVEDLLGVAKEKMSPRARRILYGILHKVRAVDAIRQAGAAEIQSPDHGHSIWQNQIKLRHHARETRVSSRLGENVSVRRTNRGRPGFARQLLNNLKRRLISHASDPRSQNANGALRHHQLNRWRIEWSKQTITRQSSMFIST